ncbi:MAG: GNAT family N-acetyltransferase [Thermoleophilia bacterium]|nr:GNAT family N-acetyltransferase [Thermoleophilia bacterium]
MTPELRAASSFPLDEVAALFAAAYEEYVVPFHVDEAQLRFMIETFDLDLDASRVALIDSEPVGLANLAIRGERGWIGGIGVVAAARRRGIGETLMRAVHEQARERGLREIWLEVIEQNEAAFRLYERLAYRVVRWVELGLYDGEPLGDGVREVGAEQAQARIRELRTEREPWQRTDETLAHYDDLRGLEAEGGAALFRVVSEGRAALLQLAGDEATARALLGAMRRHGVVALFNVPRGHPALAALRALGGRVTLRQREMVLSVENAPGPPRGTSAAGVTG